MAILAGPPANLHSSGIHRNPAGISGASLRPPTTAASPLLEGYGRRNQRVGSEEERGGWERERGGKGRGNEDAGELGRGRPFVPPPSPFSFQEPTRRTRRCKNHTPPRSSSIIPPRCGGGGEFLFKRGRVNPTRRPRFFSFRTGAV